MEIGDRVKVVEGADKGRIGKIVDWYPRAGDLPVTVEFPGGWWASFEPWMLKVVD